MKKVLLTLSLAVASIGASIAQDTVRLDETVIMAVRASKKTPVAQITVNKQDIKQAQVGVDIPYLLEMLPSTVVSSESGTGLGNTSFRIRGTDPTRINVTIDGVPLNDAESQAVFWVNMPDFASSVNSIQIQRGAGTSTNGSGAFGATVNMLTNRPSHLPYAETSATVGSFNTFTYNINAGTGRLGKGFNFDLRYSGVQSDGYIERSAARHRSLHASGGWQNERSFVKFAVLHGEERTGLSYNGVPGYAFDSLKYSYFDAGKTGYKPAGINRRYNPAGEYRDDNGEIGYYDRQIDDYSQTHYHLQSSHLISSRWMVNATLHLTRGNGYYEEYRVGRKFVEHGLPNVEINGSTIKKSDMIRQKSMDNYFYGLIFSANYTDVANRMQWLTGGSINRHDGDHFGNVLWTRINNGALAGNEWYRNNGTKDDYSLYSKLNYRLTKQLNIYGDLQYRHIGYVMTGVDSDLADVTQKHYFNFFNPKAGVFFDFDDRNSAFASFSVANREPTRADYKDAAKYGAAEAPKPERLYDAEIGYLFASSIATVGVNLYYMYYKDQLVNNGKLNSVGYPIMDNAPESYRAGVELSGGIQICKPLRFEANLTLSRNKILNFTEYVDQNDNANDWNPIDQRITNIGNTNISFSPEATGSAMLRYSPLKDLSLLLSGKYVGKQFYDNTSSEARSLDAYYTCNFRVNYSFRLYGVNLGMQALVNNIFDRQYISSAWVYRAVFADGSPDYIENGFFPQAGRNVAAKLTISF